MVLCMLGVVVFSFTVPMTKIAVRSLPAGTVGAGRAVVAAFLALAYQSVRYGSPFVAIRRAFSLPIARVGAVAAGVVVGFPFLTSFALQRTEATHGALVIALLPLTTAGVAALRTGDRPPWRYWLSGGFVVAAIGAYVVDHGGGALHLSDALLVAAVVAGAVGYTEGAILTRTFDGAEVISAALLVALPVTVAVTAVTLAGAPGVPTAASWAAFGYTALGSMFVGFLFWYAGLARAGIARGGRVQLLQPVLTIGWSWPLLGERVDRAAVLTALVVVAAMAWGRRSVQAPRARQHDRAPAEREGPEERDDYVTPATSATPS